jgi:transcriptional regulator GlxA family with amidase domain
MRIAILAVPGVQMLDLAGPMDVFAEANRQLGSAETYQVKIVAPSLEVLTTMNGARVVPDESISNTLDEYDTLIVAGSPNIRAYEDRRDLLDWIVHRSERVRRLCSICTGAFLLANAGLLNGRRATTHWNSTHRLAESFPTISVEPNRIFVKDDSIYTSAGVTASMDLALALVEEDHGRCVALRVAKELILFLKRPGGQSQFSMQLAAQLSDNGRIRSAQEWILTNLSQELSIETLAVNQEMSTRNFARQFKRETNMTPGDYVEIARVEAAQRILERSNASLKKIASICGFTDQSGLRRAFVRRVHVTPAEYRQRFPSIDVVPSRTHDALLSSTKAPMAPASR